MESIRQPQVPTLPLEVGRTFQQESMMAVRRIVVAFGQPLIDQKRHIPLGGDPPGGIQRGILRRA
jgi:hypothetical protein